MEPPPTVLAGLHVVAYAHVDDSVRFEQRRTLSVGNEWMGRVPNLAICETLEESSEAGEHPVWIQHCSEEWEPLGIAGYRSVEEAKGRIERSYHGITGKWVPTSTSKEEARAQHEAAQAAWSCSFCGRRPREVDSMFGSTDEQGPLICNHCVQSLHEAMQGEDEP